MLSNNALIEYVKDITIAKMQSWPNIANEVNGENVANFMQKIYDKLSELNNVED